uniref:Sushi domain-containing protein n=1 Tax=Ascaris lumbricoides TaxID=6252 RepID=A0A0M3HXS0_ASCLU
MGGHVQEWNSSECNKALLHGKGRYWYVCSGGELQPQGCFTSKDERIFIYGTFVQNGYEMQCIIGNDGYLQFKFTACVPGNGSRRYLVGETWEDEQHMYWFVCKADGAYLRTDIGGCVSHDKKSRIRLDDNYDFGEYTYQCQKKYNGTVQMCSVGCIHKGVHYKVGQQWPVCASNIPIKLKKLFLLSKKCVGF